MTARMAAAKKIVQKHYLLDREVTDDEVWLEVAKLLRKKLDYDDLEKHLAASFQLLGGFGL